ncbi:SulP family inorganic anion transporter [Hyphomicrobium sp.]|uniref:SulP family inorganic anion transporter n=1 Tax=Hyphomicrobium sp. TaxID=82 RepID=UPI002E3465E9|nr:SulP family inorganic anion transporter [Hyphomicrobium sp.]HEX2840856.1 SulP family inorganic anion transporter [Hyphomicrobium sp.]
MPSFARFAPGLAELSHYKRADISADIGAGLSVAAVAIPVALAYAELAGFPPQVGLYSSILPLIAYAIFGTSRQLIVGPDAATCAVVAAAVTPLAAGDPETYASLSAMLAVLTGLICVAASFLRLGVLADFLSKPILVGFLNGVALSIVLGQASKIFGFSVEETGIVPRVLEIFSKLGQVHVATLAVAAGTFVIIWLVPRILPWLPGPLAGLCLAGAAVPVFGLTAAGVKTLGVVPAGLPALAVPYVDPGHWPALLADAAGLALVSFSSLMLTARSFASKNGYEVDADQDFAALGAANVASALSQGFAISGADSRTAISDAAGGRTRAVGLVTAAAITIVLLFLTEPLQYVPIAALGAVLVIAGLSLVDIATVRLIYRIDRTEAVLSILATLGVVAVGAVNAILLAVALALVRFIKAVSRPSVEVLGKVDGFPGLHSLERHEAGQAIPGLLLFRFNAPITFFNAPYFKREVMKAVEASGPDLKHVVLDLLPIASIDSTGLLTIVEVEKALRARGIDFNAAGRATEWRNWAERRGFEEQRIRLFPTLRQAIRELSSERKASPRAQNE